MTALRTIALKQTVALIIASVMATTLAKAQDRPLDKKINAAFAAGQLSGLHSVLIIYKGQVLTETYFAGRDWRWGRSLGHRQHGPTTLHDIRSVTKSIVGLLYGIALEEGKVPGLDESLMAQFPQYADLGRDKQRASILIRHALSMKMGIQWNEELPYTDARNSEIAMEFAKDRYHFVLSRPLQGKPGQQWVYNGGAVAVVAELIARGVGMPIDKYAEEKLLKPLGITNYEWIRGRDGVPSAASGLRLTLRDMAKIGKLVLQQGRFAERQVVPREWLAQSFKPRSDLKSGLRYGYLWWLASKSLGGEPSWVAGFGNGGQRLTIQPKHDLIVAVFAGNYNRPYAWKLPVKIIREFLVPAVQAKRGK